MLSEKELHYRILKYTANNLEKNRMITLSHALEDMGLDEFIDNSQEIIIELEKRGFIVSFGAAKGRTCIRKLNLKGKYYIEEYLKANSNLKELENIIDSNSRLINVRSHLSNSKRYLLSETKEDYPNAVKEAISAAELSVRKILNDKNITLGNGVKRLFKEKKMPNEFKEVISKLYGINSNAGGIRHALNDGDSIPNYSESKFLVLIYSAFTNYLIENYDVE